MWQALDALGVRFDGVYGTSIGALNAALFAQGDLEGVVALWSNITVKQIMVVEDDDDFAVDRMIASKRDVIPFLRDNVRHFRMDISPLEALARERLDEGRIRARRPDGTVRFEELNAVKDAKSRRLWRAEGGGAAGTEKD